MAKLVSKVYGDALFEAAMERDMLSPVYEEVQSLHRHSTLTIIRAML